MLNKLFSLLGIKQNNDTSAAERNVNIKQIVQAIRAKEIEQEIPKGKLIHDFEFLGYSIGIDREFTGRYRISVFVGPHKVYGLSITQNELSDEQLEDVIDAVIVFLQDNPSVKSLPQHGLFNAHFFGNP